MLSVTESTSINIEIKIMIWPLSYFFKTGFAGSFNKLISQVEDESWSVYHIQYPKFVSKGKIKADLKKLMGKEGRDHIGDWEGFNIGDHYVSSSFTKLSKSIDDYVNYHSDLDNIICLKGTDTDHKYDVISLGPIYNFTGECIISDLTQNIEHMYKRVLGHKELLLPKCKTCGTLNEKRMFYGFSSECSNCEESLYDVEGGILTDHIKQAEYVHVYLKELGEKYADENDGKEKIYLVEDIEKPSEKYVSKLLADLRGQKRSSPVDNDDDTDGAW